MKYDPDMSRKELLQQPDELVDLLTHISDFVKTNKMLVITMAGILAAAVAGAGVYISIQRTHLREAGKMEEKTIFIMDSRVGLEGGYPSNQAKYQDALANYEKLIKQYSGTGAAKRALLGKANIFYTLNKYQETIDIYLKFLRENPGDSLTPIVKNSLAYSYEALGNYDRAIKLFEEISRGVSPNMAAEQLMNAARCYEGKNAPLKAVKLYRKARNLLAGAGRPSAGAQGTGLNPVLSRIDRKIKGLERKQSSPEESG